MVMCKKLWIPFLLLYCIGHLHGQSDASTCYIFGHSLIDHRPPINPTPSDETTVPHWLQLLANHAGKDFAVSGKYGFLPQHASQPIFSQWGYDIVNSAWESDYEPFSDADFSTIMITAGNFIQWQAHTEEYFGDPGVTPLSATLQVMDNVAGEEDSMKFIIYENWPDMGGIAPDFPPTAAQLETYYSYTAGDFHEWWVAFHNDLDANRPDLQVKMVPVGPIFADLFTNTNLKDIPVTELYEDNAPHGMPSIYFLASLASYIAIYEEKPPLDFEVPSIIHPAIAVLYEDIIDRMWQTCVEFTFGDGRNRVFTQNVVSVQDEMVDLTIGFFPNPVLDELVVKGKMEGTLRIISVNGDLFKISPIKNIRTVDMSDVPSGMYFVAFFDVNGNRKFVKRIVKM